MRLLIILSLVFTFCTNQTTTYGQDAAETQPYESFVLLENDTVGMKNRKLVAKISLKSSNYDVLLKMAEKEARSKGGNCLIITDHKKPGAFAVNHRIKAEVLRIDNPESFEKELLWHPLRPLKICNFRGAVEEGSLPSGANTTIQFNIMPDPASGNSKVVIEAKFKSEKSFFNTSVADTQRLEYEQLVFDMTEVYARKLRKLVAEEVRTSADVLELWESKLGSLLAIWYGKRTEFYMDVTEDSAAQNKWRDWIHGELHNLKDYADTEMVLALR